MTVSPKKRNNLIVRNSESECGIELEPSKISIPIMIICQEMTVTPDNSFSECIAQAENESSDPKINDSPEETKSQNSEMTLLLITPKSELSDSSEKKESPKTETSVSLRKNENWKSEMTYSSEKSKPEVTESPEISSLESASELESNQNLEPEVTRVSANRQPKISISSGERNHFIRNVKCFPEVSQYSARKRFLESCIELGSSKHLFTEGMRKNNQPEEGISLDMISLESETGNETRKHLFAEEIVQNPESAENVSLEMKSLESGSGHEQRQQHLFPEVIISRGANKNPKPEGSLEPEESKYSIREDGKNLAMSMSSKSGSKFESNTPKLEMTFSWEKNGNPKLTMSMSEHKSKIPIPRKPKPEMSFSWEKNKNPKLTMSISEQKSKIPRPEMIFSRQKSRETPRPKMSSSCEKKSKMCGPTMSVSGIELDEIKTVCSETIEPKKETKDEKRKIAKKIKEDKNWQKSYLTSGMKEAENSQKNYLKSELKLEPTKNFSQEVTFSSVPIKTRGKTCPEQIENPIESKIVSDVDMDEITTLSSEFVNVSASGDPISKEESDPIPKERNAPIPAEIQRTEQEEMNVDTKPRKVGKFWTFYR